MAVEADPGAFAARLIAWQRRHGRHDLPWQGTRDPYRIWVAEIMLQQTQVSSAIPYYERFLARFPDVAELAAAQEDEVLKYWSGLGYYARARNLHAAARVLMTRHGGSFPRRPEEIAALPGIGRSTAAAIAAFAFGTRAAILDGNVKRVLARAFGVEGFPGDKRVENRLWALAESLLPARDIEAYTQGLMDLGATLCTRARARCEACPLEQTCIARQRGLVDSLPTPRPRRALPERETAMLILRRGPEVLLEKRPRRGLWGGLWSLPEPGPETVLAPYLADRFGVRARRVFRLAPLIHGFTHFRLLIRPLLIDVEGRGDAVPGALWLMLGDAQRAAIPTPVRTLLARIGDGSVTGSVAPA